MVPRHRGYVLHCSKGAIIHAYTQPAPERRVICLDELGPVRAKTSPGVEATHPIVVDNPRLSDRYYVVHNGVISNAEALRSRHETDGFRYITLMRTEWITHRATYYDHIFNDSEALAVEPARHLDGSSAAIAADGSIAFIAWQADKQTRRLRGVHYGRNEGSPLVVHETADVLSITNEGDPSHERVSPHVLRSYDSQRRAWRERAAPIGACTPSHCSAGVSLWQSENDFTYEDDDLSNMARTDPVGEVKHAQQSGLVYDV